MNNSNTTQPTTIFNEGDKVTARNPGKGRQKATVIKTYEGQFNRDAVIFADVEFGDKTIYKGALTGLLRAV